MTKCSQNKQEKHFSEVKCVHLCSNFVDLKTQGPYFFHSIKFDVNHQLTFNAHVGIKCMTLLPARITCEM